MDIIKANKFETISPETVQASASATDTILDDSIQEYYQGLSSNAFNFETEAPTTLSEVQEDYQLGADLINQRALEDRSAIIEGLVEEGRITPNVALDYYKTPLPNTEHSLERLQADNLIINAALEDPDSANDILDFPDKTEEEKRYLTNLGITETVRQEVDAKREGKFWYGVRGFLPFVDAYRAWNSPADIYNGGLLEYAENLYVEFQRRMEGLPPEEYNKWLRGFVEYLHQQGEDWNRIEELLTKAYRPINEMPASLASDFFDVTGVARAVKSGAVVGALAARMSETSTLKGAAKGAAKGAVKGALETVLFAPTAYKLTKGTLKAAKSGLNIATDKVAAKMAVGSLKGAAMEAVNKIAKAVKAGTAGIEKADKATDLVYEYMVEPFAKASVGPLNSTAGLIGTANDLLTTQKYYQSASTIATALGEKTIMPRVMNELFKKGIERINTTLDESSNLMQVTDLTPIIDNEQVFARSLIGNGRGGAFTTQKQAENALKRFRRLSDPESVSSEIIQTSPRTYFIQADAKIADNIAELHRLTGKGNERGWKVNVLLGTRGSMPERIEALRATQARDSSFIRGVVDKYTKAVKALSKKERGILESLKDIGESGDFWFTPEYLVASGIPERVVNAYQSLRLAEDLEYVAKGFYIAKRLSEEGYMRIATHPEKPIMTGKIVSPDNALFDSHWFTRADGEAPFKMTKEEYLKNYKDYTIIEGIYEMDEIPANKVYLLAPSDNVLAKPLDKFFGSYVPGFRHYYAEDTFFIKQPVLKQLPSGHWSLSDVHTIRGAKTYGEAKKYADELNEIRKVMNEYLGVPSKSKAWEPARKKANTLLRNMDNTYLNFNNVDDALMFAEENGIDFLAKDAVVGVLKEGDDGTIFRNALKGTDAESQERFLKYMKQYNWSSPSAIARLERGEGVKDIATDQHLPWIDVNKELNKVVRNIERYGSMEDFTRIFASNWADEFKDVVDVSVDPVVALSRGEINKTGNPLRVQQAQYGKLMHDYIRGVPNELDRAVESWLGNNLIELGNDHEWLKKIPGLGGAFKEGSRTYNFITKLTPLELQKTWAAHYTLGCMRFKQLFTQALAVVNTILISPKAGFQAIPYAFVVPSLLLKSDDAAFEAGAKMLQRMGQDCTAKQLKQLVKNVELFDVFGQSIKGGALAGMDTKTSKIADASLWFFKKGEAYNRVHSPITALIERGLQFKDIGKTLKPSELSELLVRSENLYMNMGKTGISKAQMSHLGRVLLQMKGFQLRALESIVGGTLTGKERSRLAVAHVLGTGIKGAVGTSIGYNFYNWMTEDVGVPEEVMLPVYEGFLNTLTRQIMTNPIDLGGYLAPEYLGILEDIYDASTEGPIKYVVGATVFGKTWDGIATIGNALSDWVWGEPSTISVKNLFQMLNAKGTLPPALQEDYNTLHILFAGEKLDKSGALVGKDFSMMDGVYNLLGLKTLDEIDYYEFLKRLGDESEKVENATKDALPIFIMAAKDPGQGFNVDLFEHMFGVISDNYGLTMKQRSEVWKNVNKRAKTSLHTDYKSRLIQGIVKQKGFEKGNNELEARRIW